MGCNRGEYKPRNSDELVIETYYGMLQPKRIISFLLYPSLIPRVPQRSDAAAWDWVGVDFCRRLEMGLM